MQFISISRLSDDYFCVKILANVCHADHFQSNNTKKISIIFNFTSI